MIESEQPTEEPAGPEQRGDEDKSQRKRRPAAGPAASAGALAGTAQPRPRHRGQIHLGLGWDTAGGHENILLFNSPSTHLVVPAT